MPFALRNPFKQGGKDEASSGHNALEKAIEERGSAVLETRYHGIPGSMEPCTFVAEAGHPPESYQVVEKHVTSNYPLEEVHWPDTEGGQEAGDIWVFAPQEGRKYLKGGEAKVAVVDAKDARIIVLERPSDEHMPQDGLGFAFCRDSAGAIRIGVAVLDGKTKVDIGDASYVPYSSGKGYYSKADQFARFGSGYLPRRLALGFGNIRHEVTQAMRVIDGYKRGEFVPYGFESEKVPYGTSTAQLTAIKITGTGVMELQVLNLGKAGSGLESDDGDLGGHVLMADEYGVSRLGNDLELGTYGTKKGYSEIGLIYATAHKSGGVVRVPEQVYYSFTDGFRVVRQPVRLDGKTSISVEQLASMAPADIVDVLESGASAIFGNPKASHDDGTLVMIVPNSIRAKGGFSYGAFYKPVEPVSSTVEIKSRPVAELPSDVKDGVITSDQIAQLATPALGEPVFEGVDKGVVAASVAQVQVATVVAENIDTPIQALGSQPEATSDSDLAVAPAPVEVVPQTVIQSDEMPVSDELLNAATIIAQRLGVAIVHKALEGRAEGAFTQVAAHLEAKMSELTALIEAGWRSGKVDLDAVAKLFGLDIDSKAIEAAVARAKAKAATTKQTKGRGQQQTPQTGKESKE